jgi:hypothetical protein
MEYFGLTDRGKIRKDNQDCFLVQSNEKAKCLVAVLCDGMGGAKAGGLASDVASKAFVAYADERLSESGIRKPLYGISSPTPAPRPTAWCISTPASTPITAAWGRPWWAPRC